jgi:hypothetical protein
MGVAGEVMGVLAMLEVAVGQVVVLNQEVGVAEHQVKGMLGPLPGRAKATKVVAVVVLVG